MTITLSNAGKKFYREWIFRKLDLTISPGERIVLLGPNGSGKSTLLQMIMGAVTPNEGTVTCSDVTGKAIEVESIYRHISIAAPYLELIEDMTLTELIDFHFCFKQPVTTVNSVLNETGLASKKDSIIRFFSSGMKQRVKLSLAICSASDFLFLDEPCSNLDAEGIRWYRELIDRHTQGRTIIVASNTVREEYDFCDRHIRITDYK